MIERPGPILRFIFNRYFRSIEFPAAGAEKIRAAAEKGTVVYVWTSASYVDYLYFTFALLRHGLPLAKMANGVSTVLLQPLGRVLGRLWHALFGRPAAPDRADWMAERVAAGQSALVFLRRPQTALGWSPRGFRGPYVEALITRQKTTARPIVFVPLTLLWGSPAVRSGARRGFIDWVFGDREAPGFVRSMWTFFNHFSDSQVLVGEPLWLPEFLAAEGSAELPLDVAARRLRWTLGGRLEAEVRVVRGPQLKSARRIRTEVLRGRRLVEVAKECGQRRKDLGQGDRAARRQDAQRDRRRPQAVGVRPVGAALALGVAADLRRAGGRSGRARSRAVGGAAGAAHLGAVAQEPRRLPGSVVFVRGQRSGAAAHRRRRQSVVLAHGLVLPALVRVLFAALVSRRQALRRRLPRLYPALLREGISVVEFFYRGQGGRTHPASCSAPSSASWA